MPALEANRSYSEPRQEVIAATPALHERELTKMAALTDALVEALKARGVAELRAVLSARIGMAVYVQATLVWLHVPNPDLGERMDLVQSEMTALLASCDSVQKTLRSVSRALTPDRLHHQNLERDI